MTLMFGRWWGVPTVYERLLVEDDLIHTPRHTHHCPRCYEDYPCEDTCSLLDTDMERHDPRGSPACCNEPACVGAEREAKHDELRMVAECTGYEPVDDPLWTHGDHVRWMTRYPPARPTEETLVRLYPSAHGAVGPRPTTASSPKRRGA